MSRRGPVIGAAIVALVMVVSAVVALSVGTSTKGARSLLSTDGKPLLVSADRAPQVPELALAADWVGSPALSRSSLLGKVVWVDFWDASCINCRRTFPALQTLSRTYADAGLVVVGVHTPEFDFERSVDYVRDSAQRLGVTWPVANDPQRKVWDSFGNQYWPAQYLVDRQGRVRFAHVGEGDDDQLEAAVRELLGGDLPAPVAGATASPTAARAVPSDLTPERYLGAERGADTLGSVVAAGATVTRDDAQPPAQDHVGLRGRFTGAAESLTAQADAEVALAFTGRDVYAVLRPAAGSTTVEVLLDGKPVPADLRGPDLRVEGDRTLLDVTRQDLWHLLTGAAGEGVRHGVLTFVPRGGSLQVFTFTFGA